MKKLTFQFVFRQIPNALAYFFVSFLASIVLGFFIFSLKKSLYETILNLWFKRLLFGFNFFGKSNPFWFTLNNIIVMLLIVLATALMVFLIMRRKPSGFSSRPRMMERRHPKITLASLYMIPIGALVINSFLIGFFLTYAFLNYGFNEFKTSVLLLVPHGINEMLALILATSLALAYIKILSPFVLSRRWDVCRKKVKELLLSNVTMFVVFLIILLTLFSGFVEGMLTLLITR